MKLLKTSSFLHFIKMFEVNLCIVITAVVAGCDDGNREAKLAWRGSFEVGGERTAVDRRQIDNGATDNDPWKIGKE